jgi:hypothetical protein
MIACEDELEAIVGDDGITADVDVGVGVEMDDTCSPLPLLMFIVVSTSRGKEGNDDNGAVDDVDTDEEVLLVDGVMLGIAPAPDKCELLPTTNVDDGPALSVVANDWLLLLLLGAPKPIGMDAPNNDGGDDRDSPPTGTTTTGATPLITCSGETTLEVTSNEDDKPDEGA